MKDVDALRCLMAAMDEIRPLIRQITRGVLELSFQDVEQEVWTRAWERRTSVAQSNPCAWMRTTALNLVADMRRRQGTRGSLQELSDLATNSRSADDLARIDAVEAVARALDVLTALERVVFVRRHAFGETCAAIAHSLGIAESTARSHLSRARAKLVRHRASAVEGDVA